MMIEKNAARCHKPPRHCCMLDSGCGLLAALGLLIVATSFVATRSAFADDTYRPQFHLTPPAGWMNDPCGLYYANGLYHRNYLWSPEAAPVEWGDNWAHMVSTDLVHWIDPSILADIQV